LKHPGRGRVWPDRGKVSSRGRCPGVLLNAPFWVLKLEGASSDKMEMGLWFLN